MNRKHRDEVFQAKRSAKQRLEADDTDHTFATLLRTGQKLTPFEVASIVPQASLSTCKDISERLNWALNPPANRAERRRRDHWIKSTIRSLDKAVNAALPVYEARERMLSKESKETYKNMCRTMKPHPDGRFAGHALDTAEITELRKALFEIHLMDTLFAKIYRAMKRAA